MTGKAALQAALRHEEGPLCVDFGATAVTGMHVRVVAALRDAYGLPPRPVKVCEPYQMLGEVEPDLMDALGIDVTALPAPNTIFGFRNENWREYRMPWGQEVLVPEHFQTMLDANGDVLIFPQGDREAPPSGRMPVGGFFFDTIIRQPPIDDDNLDPSDNLEEFGPLSEADLNVFRSAAERLKDSPYGIVVTLPGTAIGDIALVPAPFLKHPRGIRDVAEWYMSTVARQDYLHAVFSEQTRIAIENMARIHAIVGELPDAVFVCGTDFGTQTSQFCSVETYDALYSPYYRQISDWIHAHTTWKTFKHSCGAVEPFIEHFIADGFEILNPVQCSAAGMDPAVLKQRYGDRVTFWGGGVDTQKTLPFGTPADVRAEVLDRCRIFSPRGGFVFNAIHNIQANAPVENVVAMFEALKTLRA
ncbi:MAG: methyltransferase [Lentisphaerae bacterium]|nr:methyltransferase [Lentisphaerota bacterium]